MRILVTVPTGDSWIHTGVVHALDAIRRESHGHKVCVSYPRFRPFENNLHHCVRDLLDGEYDYWLSIDSDNPPVRNPLELIALDKDVIGLPTPVWRCEGATWPWYWNAYKRDGEGYRPHPVHDGLQRVDAIGTGCFIAARRVFEHPSLQSGAFHRTYDEHGCMLKGNDIAFCERATDAGFSIYAHFGYPCNHYVTVPMLELIQAVSGAYEREREIERKAS